MTRRRTAILTDQTVAERVGAATRGVRAMLSLTQQDLAGRMGINLATLRAIEADDEVTAPRYLTQLCKATGLRLGDVDTLMDLYVAMHRNMPQRAAHD